MALFWRPWITDRKKTRRDFTVSRCSSDQLPIVHSEEEVTSSSTLANSVPYSSTLANKRVFRFPEDRFTDMRPIGEGAYGLVFSAYDNKQKSKVAIKKFLRFKHNNEARSVYNEMFILRKLKQHENIIDIHDVICVSSSMGKLEEVYLVQSLMTFDLFKVMKDNRLTMDQICYLVYQIIRALKFIHSGNIIHRDLKPSNLLLNPNCDLKICDFSMST